MEKGYYIPEIKEFHVGFEYEERYNEDTLFFKEIVKDDIEEWPNYDQLSKIKWSIHNIRVKYLNKEDIESLNIKDYSIILNNGFVDIWRKHDSYPIIRNINLKNKSELIVFLKQTGIIKE